MEKSGIISNALLQAYKIPEVLSIDTSLEPLSQVISLQILRNRKKFP